MQLFGKKAQRILSGCRHLMTIHLHCHVGDESDGGWYPVSRVAHGLCSNASRTSPGSLS